MISGPILNGGKAIAAVEENEKDFIGKAEILL
jgi:hypothetical protein